MEQLTRSRPTWPCCGSTRSRTVAAGRKPLEVEVVGLRVGDFVLVTFPGELTVRDRPEHQEGVSAQAHLRGRLHERLHLLRAHGRAAEERRRAQEDSDCLLAPGWQPIFEAKAADILRSSVAGGARPGRELRP